MLKVKLKKEKVERLMIRRNLSQNSLAKRIEVSSGYMSQLMNGIRCASPQVRTKLQHTFNRGFDELFEIKEVEP